MEYLGMGEVNMDRAWGSGALGAVFCFCRASSIHLFVEAR